MAIPNGRITRRLQADHCVLWRRYDHIQGLPIPLPQQISCGRSIVGAEDYVVKPFSPTELTARIRAALRRRSNPVPFVLGELAIDYDRRRVTVAGRAVTLTPTEYELLRALAQGAGRILTHEDLLRQVWAGRGHGKVKPKIVRAYVKRLRHRLGDDAARPAWIVNERGVGYRMPRPGEAGEP